MKRAIREPSLFPDGNAGITYAAVKWADAFFRAGLHLAIGATSAMWPAEFRQDRQGLFPDIDFGGVDLAHARSQMLAHAGFIEQQLADGRAFLSGAAPGLIDIHAWTVPWFTRASVPGVNELFAIIEVFTKKGKMVEIEHDIAGLENVCAVYDVTGESDTVIVDKFKNRDDLSKFVKTLSSRPNVDKTITNIVLNTVKEDFRLV